VLFGNLPSKRAEPGVVDMPRTQQVSVRRFYKFERVAWPNSHLIEDASRKSDLTLCGDFEKHGDFRAVMPL